MAYKKVKLERMFITERVSFPRNRPAKRVFPNEENVKPKSASIVGVKNLKNVLRIKISSECIYIKSKTPSSGVSGKHHWF